MAVKTLANAPECRRCKIFSFREKIRGGSGWSPQRPAFALCLIAGGGRGWHNKEKQKELSESL